jgi:hypothetical protein
MSTLKGLKEYLDECYSQSIFDEIAETGAPFNFRIHERGIVCGEVLENMVYDISFKSVEGVQEILPKTSIQYLYSMDAAEGVLKLVKRNPEVESLSLQPIIPSKPRYHIKNKTLFPLMEDKHVVFFTMLEGDVLRGVINGFNRYEITLHLKGGVPITILRHGVYDLRDKRSRCFLKSSQETLRDWEKSPYYVSV